VRRVAVGGGPVPARGPLAGGRDGGRRRGSRRAGCTPGRCVPARRCVIPAPVVGGGMVPPPLRAAMLAAAIRPRCPWCPQCGQRKFLPAGFGTRREHAGQVEDVPRSSTSLTVIPAASALSTKTRIRYPTRQSRVRWLCRRPALRSRTPRGSPTASVPARCSTAQATTVLAASCWAWRTRRRCRAPACRCLRLCWRQRRDPRCPGLGARRAVAQVRGPCGRAAAGGREAQHPPVQGELPCVPADRDQAPLAPGEPRRGISRAAPFRSGEPGVGVAAQHRPDPALSSSPRVPGPDSASSRHSSW
jgi:hypothetical protein